MNPYVTVLVATGVSLVTALVTVVFGPSLRTRAELRRDRLLRSEQLLARYSEPLVYAAYDLQNRLYFLLQGEYRKSVFDRNIIPYVTTSTVWLFGQFLACVEILRREIQVLDLGDLARTSILQRQIIDVTDILSAGARQIDVLFAVPRGDQRAIGEIMVVARQVSGQQYSDCMGYAEFCSKLEAEESFAKWFSALNGHLQQLTDPEKTSARGVLIQRVLVDLVDLLDPDRIRFPDLSERGKLPLPAGIDWVISRPRNEVARFRVYVKDYPVWQMVDEWSASHRIVRNTCGDGASGGPKVILNLRKFLWNIQWQLILKVSGAEVLVLLARASDFSAHCARTSSDYPWSPVDSAPRSQITQVNGLLDRLDRPRIRRRRLPSGQRARNFLQRRRWRRDAN
jgi:hypothetical protein